MTGVAKVKGKALSDAEIIFIPVESTIGAGASGKTDSNGNFTLTYSQGGTGPRRASTRLSPRKKRRSKISPSVPDLPPPGMETLPNHISSPELSRTYVTVAKGGGAVEVNFK